MKKIKLGAQTFVYPMPAFLIGADVAGKANFMTAAWSGIANSSPPMATVALQHHRHTLKGIKENGTFSINVPSVDQVRETDYCGIVSGARKDKTRDCAFEVFYGELETAPLIAQCPLNLECKVIHMLNLGSHTLVVGQVVETHVSEACTTDGLPDVAKVKPLVYSAGAEKAYHGVGAALGLAFSAGKELK
ncbi:flavin reductase family protein [Desulfatitalea tepidiphila]|uniref:flavin reductase family protein n=1 Tax=Desulfatitalea tepidiphila TaxID=1185843 RepID=UPI0006B66CD1|nr:flavin reductase family protein [Desulfatitalea tepidiphila]